MTSPAPITPAPLAITPRPLPPSVQPTLRAEHVVGKPLVNIRYSVAPMRTSWVQPIWNADVAKYHHERSVSDFNAVYGNTAHKTSSIWLIQGSRDDAYRAAADRAQMSVGHAQANAVLDAGEGQFLVASLGSWKNTTFKYAAIDDAGDGSFAKSFGTITDIVPQHPNLIAVVGARSVIEFDSPTSTSSTPTSAGTSSDSAPSSGLVSINLDPTIKN